MRDIDFCELSVEEEEYLLELLCTGGAYALDLFARELDQLCRGAERRLPARDAETALPGLER